MNSLVSETCGAMGLKGKLVSATTSIVLQHPAVAVPRRRDGAREEEDEINSIIRSTSQLLVYCLHPNQTVNLR